LLAHQLLLDQSKELEITEAYRVRWTCDWLQQIVRGCGSPTQQSDLAIPDGSTPLAAVEWG